MLILDVTLLLIVAILHRTSLAPTASKIIYLEFAGGITFGYLSPILFAYDLLAAEWFFVVRAYIMLAAMVLLVVENAPYKIGMVIVLGIIYNLLMFFEYALSLYSWVDTYYTPFMLANMFLQVLYVFGISKGAITAYERIMDNIRSVTDRMFCGIIVNTFT